ncbi:MAG: MCP four helix bundle domain-containing protein, partial [Clostridiaceae bacterium]
MKWFYNLKISTKLISSFVVVALISGAMGVYAIFNLKAISASDSELYKNMTVPISEMGSISTNFQRVRVNARDMINADSDDEINANIEKINERKDSIKILSESFDKTIKSTEMRTKYDEFLAVRQVYISELDKVIALARENKDEEAYAILSETGSCGIASRNEQDAIDTIIQMKIEDAKEKENANTKQADFTILVMLIILGLVMFISILLGYMISRIISNPIKKALNMINEMKKGHFKLRLNLNTKDEVGQMASAMDEFSDELQNHVIAVMDNISQGNVNMEIELKDEEDELAPALKKTVETIKGLGEEVKTLINAAQDGNLDIRGDEASFDGGWKEIIQGINGLVEVIAKPVKEVTNAMNEMSEGHLDVSVDGDYKGEFKVLADAVNNTASRLKIVVGEISD